MTSKEFNQMAKNKPWLKIESVTKLQGDGMNKTERKFRYFLELGLKDGVFTWVSDHDAITLKLAGMKCRYTPDFCTMGRDGRLTFWEVKGFWRDDARVKIKVAASKYRWSTFIAVSRKAGKWNFETIQIR